VIQYFEAAVLIRDPNAAGDPGTTPEDEQIMRVIRSTDLGVASTADRALPPSDGSIQGPFREFYDRINGPWRLGSPISAELIEDVGGIPTRVQYFQNGRLEWNAATNIVAVSSLGKSAWDAQCAAQR
jgi:hypothetical protein